MRARALKPAHLVRSLPNGEELVPLALVEVTLAEWVWSGIADLTDPETLTAQGIRPDELASRSRDTTQAIAKKLAALNILGFRWSAIHGDWHATVLFQKRITSGGYAYGDPEPIKLDHEAVTEAAEALNIS